MQAPIVTLTMNPALDVSSAVDRVVPERKLRCGPSTLHPGGGGINVARAIRNLGGSARAVYPLGGPDGEVYRGLAKESGIEGEVIAIDGNTRENFTISETSSGRQYRFVLPGPRLSEAEWQACLSAVADRLPRGGYLIASGSLPPGVPEDFYAMLARVAADSDARVVVDASGPPLTAALDEGVFLVKPSREELSELVAADRELDVGDLVEAARSLVRGDRAEVVALTLGAEGALLISGTDVMRLPTPRVAVVSAVGAGDAFPWPDWCSGSPSGIRWGRRSVPPLPPARRRR
jgi:6-phosphofructokinase 2